MENERINKEGRPFGGKCWVIANHIKVKSHEVLNNDVMVLEINNGSDQSVFLVGIWLPFDDNSYDRLANIQSNISLLETFLAQHENEQVFILGVFNCDTKRNKRFDKIFNNFILKNNLFDCISLFELQFNFTYNLLNYYLIIDHVLIDKTAILSVSECKIVVHPFNTSDHNPITWTFNPSNILEIPCILSEEAKT